QELGWTGHLQAYDTLPIAQSLGGGSAKLTALAERFGVPVGRAHHALDDTRMLVGVYEEIAKTRSLGRFNGDCLEYYDAERGRLGIRGPSIEEVINNLGGRDRMDRLREERDAASRYPEAVERLESLIEQAPEEP